MTPHDAANELREAVAASIPDTRLGRPLKASLEQEIQQIEITFDGEALCRVARIVQHAVGLFEHWMGYEGLGSDMVDTVLDHAGCEE